MTLIAALAVLALDDGSRWNTTVTRSFRVDTSGPPNHVASVSWFGKAKDPFHGKWPGPTRVDLYERDGVGGSRLLTSTQVEEGIWLWDVAVHQFLPHESFEDAQGNYHKFFPINFLTMEANGGQHSHTLVWWFDPKTMRPQLMLDVLYGETQHLKKGWIVENKPTQYISKIDIPKGVKPRRGYLRRTWEFDDQKFRFDAGPWRR